MLVALYLAAEYGGSISAVLIGTPGTAAATATVMDGFPLNQKGQPGKALGASLVGSTFGGVVGGTALMLISEPVAVVALKFGPVQFCALGIFGLAIISSLSGDSPLKGLLMAAIGVALTIVGVDPISGGLRFTFGFYELYEGIPFLTALIGLFALTEVFSMIEEIGTGKKADSKAARGFLSLRESIRLVPTFIRGSVIGTIVGAVPGAGANIASWIAYDQEKRCRARAINSARGASKGWRPPSRPTRPASVAPSSRCLPWVCLVRRRRRC